MFLKVWVLRIQYCHPRDILPFPRSCQEGGCLYIMILLGGPLDQKPLSQKQLVGKCFDAVKYDCKTTKQDLMWRN
jgi:hypothetical protein